MQSGPTWSSRTSACRRASTDEGIQAATRLRETNPEVGVVVLSQYVIPSYVLALLEGGSEGRAYLLKERVKDLEQLVAAIHAVADGGSVSTRRSWRLWWPRTRGARTRRSTS